MASQFDAAARLAEGRPAVDDVEEYVAACRRLGYQHQDLTRYAGQVRDWYDSEDGLDLRALDADCAALSAAAAAAEDATRTQTGLAAELSAAWSGRGAAAAAEFGWRTGQAATAVAAAVRTAADAAATLRDELWRAVDAKVEAVQAIDGRQQAQRAEWLAAVRTVTTGAGDVAAASELVDLRVKPFVANDIGSDWVAAMRAATVSITAAYDAASAGLSQRPPAVFDVPGELGPRFGPAQPDGGGNATAPAMSTVPVAAVGPAPPMASTAGGVGLPASVVASSPGPAPAFSSPPADPPVSAPMTSPAGLPPMSSMPSLGELGGGPSALGSGLSGLGSSGLGLSGLGQQLADLIGGLVGSANGGLSGADGIDGLDEPTAPDGPADPGDESSDDSAAEADKGQADKEDPPPDDGPAEGDAAAEQPEPEEVNPEAAKPEPSATSVPPQPPSSEPPVSPAVPAVAAEAAERAPCEIAAGELPQVGE